MYTMQHILPTGLKRYRHYGLLANPAGHRLAQARAALNMPVSNPVATECVQAFMQRVARVQIRQCPVCQHGQLVVVQVLAGARQLPAPGQKLPQRLNSDTQLLQAWLRHTRPRTRAPPCATSARELGGLTDWGRTKRPQEDVRAHRRALRAMHTWRPDQGGAAASVCRLFPQMGDGAAQQYRPKWLERQG